MTDIKITIDNTTYLISFPDDNRSLLNDLYTKKGKEKEILCNIFRENNIQLIDSIDKDYNKLIIELYKKYAPNDIHESESMLSNYKELEDELLKIICTKYSIDLNKFFLDKSSLTIPEIVLPKIQLPDNPVTLKKGTRFESTKQKKITKRLLFTLLFLIIFIFLIAFIYKQRNNFEDKVRLTMNEYYNGLNSKSFNANLYFAPHVENFILMDNTTPDLINNYINDSYYKEYTNATGQIEDSSFKVSKKGDNYIADYIEKGECDRTSLKKHQETRAKVKVIMNDDFKITYLVQYEIIENYLY